MSELTVAKGSCLCGAVSLSTTSMNPHVAACDCNMSQKWGRGALMAVECKSDVSFRGEENIELYQSSKWAERGFCKKCGSHLFYRFKKNYSYFIPVGIFDDESDLVLTHQVFIDEKPEYYAFANETKNMTGEEIFAQFAPTSEK